jgi:hypothetical protein
MSFVFYVRYKFIVRWAVSEKIDTTCFEPKQIKLKFASDNVQCWIPKQISLKYVDEPPNFPIICSLYEISAKNA